ncbi:MAG TPA: hypothetical protein VOA41_17725 [Candidatus Dormibacteraeota bacterium]|nr:hypothetical protein [Candidatus Dormibacteraeota bacterium]
MTGTKKNPGGPEVVDLETLLQESNLLAESRRTAERSARLEALRYPDLVSSLSEIERVVLELKELGQSFERVSDELASRGIVLSTAGVFKAHKRAIEKLVQIARSMRNSRDPRLKAFIALLPNDCVVRVHGDEPHAVNEDNLPRSPSELVDSRYTEVFPENGMNKRYLNEPEPHLTPHLKVHDSPDDFDSEETDLICGLDRESPSQ